MGAGNKSVGCQEKLSCLIFKSIYPCGSNCPNKIKGTLQDVNRTLFTWEMHECYIAKFVGENIQWCSVR